jgi:hypothetical protein
MRSPASAWIACGKKDKLFMKIRISFASAIEEAINPPIGINAMNPKKIIDRMPNNIDVLIP